jgi:ribosomal protein S18 acetylase RimI-like enzyme
MKTITTTPAFRFLTSLRRSSKVVTPNLLRQQEDVHEPLIFRETICSDLPALAALHVKTWNDTYPDVKHPPTYELRESQWRETFEVDDDSWFCFVIENFKGQLIGFAKGKKYNHTDLPDFSGELNKIYLLREYQRMGLGRRLVGCVSRRFLSLGINSMVLFAEADNPSCKFYEALEGKKIGGPTSGNYGWHDLRHLASICPIGLNMRGLMVEPKL